MAPATTAIDEDDDWDSEDDDSFSSKDGVETSVHLGVPDGSIEDSQDLLDAAVSRIGGPPAMIVNTPVPFSSSYCKICETPMEMLIQILCPFEDSPYDRSLYIWGCSKASCQSKSKPNGGSVRAWRGLQLNPKRASKLEAKRKAQEQKNVPATPSAKANPFSTAGTQPSASFGSGLDPSIFGKPPPPTTCTSDEESDSDIEDTLTLATNSLSLADSPWTTCPTYLPLYLSTVSEYIPPPSSTTTKQAKRDDPDDYLTNDDNADTGGGTTKWLTEAYENSMDLDQVFERFSKRVSIEGEQCLRYDLNGVPLPFASDQVFDALFPKEPTNKPGDIVPITKAEFKVTSSGSMGNGSNAKRDYSLNKPRKAQELVPQCSICGSDRVFECQIMPNLLNVCKKPSSITPPSTATGTNGGAAATTKEDGMEWGTCMVFSCEKDCCIPDEGQGNDKSCWREEVVLIQWDT